MIHDDRLSELLLLWEERRRRGERVAAMDLCRDCPELIPALDEQIRALSAMDGLMGGAQSGQDTEVPADTNLKTRQDRSSAGQHMSTASQYQVVRSHARGGLGEVLVAHDQRLGRNVALKVIRQPHDRDPVRRRRFVREAEITSRLEHPGIVPVHGIGEDSEGRLCYAMRLISGETLHDAITRFHSAAEHKNDERTWNLAFRQLLTRFVSVCNTLAYAHSQGVLHRDIKPANIMLGAFGETLVVDWGLAKKFSADSPSDSQDSAAMETMDISHGNPSQNSEADGDPATHMGQTLGTPSFMSPEQSRGEAQLTAASDIYCLGATLYMLLTGVPPFAGRNVVEIIAAVQRGDSLPPRQVNARIAKSLDAICLKAMALRPADRYASALELATDIEKWLADQPVSAHRDSFIVRSGRWMRRHRLWVVSGSASLLVAIVSLIVLLGFMSRANDQLRTANELEKQAKAEAIVHAQTATKNAELAELQSDLALRSLQSVTFDIQRQLKHVPAAHNVRRRLLDTALRGLAEVAAKLEQRPQIDLGLMTAHRDLGDVFFEVGSESGGSGGTEGARTQYQRAFDIAEALVAADPANHDAQRQLAICLDKLGDIHGRIGSTTTAREHYQNSFAIREKLLEATPKDERALRDVSVSCNRLGDVALKLGEIESARNFYQRALDIRRDQEARKIEDYDLIRDLALSHAKVGEVTLRLGDAQRAMEVFREGLRLSQRHAKEAPNDDQAQRDLTVAYDKLGNVARVLGNTQDSADYYEQSLEITSRRATADPVNAEIQRDLMQALQKTVDVLTKLGKLDEAQTHQEHAIRIGEQLVAADPENRDALRDLAMAYTARGDQLAAKNPNEEAIRWYRKSLEVRKQRAAASPSDPRGQTDVAFGLTKLGDGLLAMEQVDQALQCYGDALRIHQERSAANTKDRLARSNLAAYHQRIGVACRRAGRFDESAKHYQDALKIAEKLGAEDVNDVPVRIMMLTFYHSLGYLDQSRNRFSEARKWYHQGLDLAQQLSAAEKLVGEDATWVSYIQDALRECDQQERANAADAEAKIDEVESTNEGATASGSGSVRTKTAPN